MDARKNSFKPLSQSTLQLQTGSLKIIWPASHYGEAMGLICKCYSWGNLRARLDLATA